MNSLELILTKKATLEEGSVLVFDDTAVEVVDLAQLLELNSLQDNYSGRFSTGFYMEGQTLHADPPSIIDNEHFVGDKNYLSIIPNAIGINNLESPDFTLGAEFTLDMGNLYLTDREGFVPEPLFNVTESISNRGVTILDDLVAPPNGEAGYLFNVNNTTGDFLFFPHDGEILGRVNFKLLPNYSVTLIHTGLKFEVLKDYGRKVFYRSIKRGWKAEEDPIMGGGDGEEEGYFPPSLASTLAGFIGTPKNGNFTNIPGIEEEGGWFQNPPEELDNPWIELELVEDEVFFAKDYLVEGNILDNDSLPPGAKLIYFKYNNVVYVLNKSHYIDGLGTLTLNSDGSFTFVATTDDLAQIDYFVSYRGKVYSQTLTFTYSSYLAGVREDLFAKSIGAMFIRVPESQELVANLSSYKILYEEPDTGVIIEKSIPKGVYSVSSDGDIVVNPTMDFSVLVDEDKQSFVTLSNRWKFHLIVEKIQAQKTYLQIFNSGTYVLNMPGLKKVPSTFIFTDTPGMNTAIYKDDKLSFVPNGALGLAEAITTTTGQLRTRLYSETVEYYLYSNSILNPRIQLTEPARVVVSLLDGELPPQEMRQISLHSVNSVPVVSNDEVLISPNVKVETTNDLTSGLVIVDVENLVNLPSYISFKFYHPTHGFTSTKIRITTEEVVIPPDVQVILPEKIIQLEDIEVPNDIFDINYEVVDSAITVSYEPLDVSGFPTECYVSIEAPDEINWFPALNGNVMPLPTVTVEDTYQWQITNSSQASIVGSNVLFDGGYSQEVLILRIIPDNCPSSFKDIRIVTRIVDTLAIASANVSSNYLTTVNLLFTLDKEDIRDNLQLSNTHGHTYHPNLGYKFIPNIASSYLTFYADYDSINKYIYEAPRGLHVAKDSADLHISSNALAQLNMLEPYSSSGVFYSLLLDIPAEDESYIDSAMTVPDWYNANSDEPGLYQSSGVFYSLLIERLVEENWGCYLTSKPLANVALGNYSVLSPFYSLTIEV